MMNDLEHASEIFFPVGSFLGWLLPTSSQYFSGYQATPVVLNWKWKLNSVRDLVTKTKDNNLIG